MNILYLHGFNSAPNNSNKYQILRAYCIKHGYDLTTPKIDYRNIESEIRRLTNMIQEDEWVIIGSSLGGWLAYTLSRLTLHKCVLINPSIEPNVSLAVHNNKTLTNHGNGDVKEWLPMHTKQYNKLIINNIAPTLVLLDSADEVIDSHNSYRMFENYAQVEMFDGGDHRFQHMLESMIYIDEMVNHVHL